jgi:hypothetical protein
VEDGAAVRVVWTLCRAGGGLAVAAGVQGANLQTCRISDEQGTNIGIMKDACPATDCIFPLAAGNAQHQQRAGGEKKEGDGIPWPSPLDATTMQASITGFALSPATDVLPTCSISIATSRTAGQTQERIRSKVRGHSGSYATTRSLFMLTSCSAGAGP